MKYDNSSGIQVDTVQSIIQKALDIYNANENKNLTMKAFELTEFYRVVVIVAQLLVQTQTKTASMYDQIIDYIHNNQMAIESPSNTIAGITPAIYKKFGFDSSLKPSSEADAGKVYLAIDYQPTADINLKIANFILDKLLGAGIYTIGDIQQPVSIDDSNEIIISWTNAKVQDLHFKINLKISRNRNTSVPDKDLIKSRFLNNFEEIYSIGQDIEPERYLDMQQDIPFASEYEILYSLDGENWQSGVLNSDFDNKYIAQLDVGNINVTS